MTAPQPTHDHAKDEAALRSLLEQLEERTRQHERDFTELTDYRNTGLEPEQVAELKTELAEARRQERIALDGASATVGRVGQIEDGLRALWNRTQDELADAKAELTGALGDVEMLSKAKRELEFKLTTLESARSKCIRHSAVDCVPCKDAAERVLCEWNYGEAFGERIGLCAVFEMADEYKTQRIGIVLRSVANQLRQAIGLSSARQSDRELVELRERAEGAEARTVHDTKRIEALELANEHLTTIAGERMEKLAAAESSYDMLAQDFAGAKADREAMGVALAAAEAELAEWRQVMGEDNTQSVRESNKLRVHIERDLRERLAAAEARAEGAEARCRVASIRLRDTIEGRNDGPTDLEEYVERAITHIRDLDSLLNKALADNEGWKRRCHDELEPERDRLKDKLAELSSIVGKFEDKMHCMTYNGSEQEGAAKHTIYEIVSSIRNVLPKFLTPHASTTPAEQPGRAGLSVDEALSVINRGGMVTDKGGDSWFFMHGAPHWLDDKDEWIYSSKDTMREHAPFKVTKEPTP